MDAPVEGDAAVFHICNATTGETIADASTLLGPGRDYMDMEDAASAALNAPADPSTGFDGITSTLHGPYSTITALLADFPDAKLDGTARGLLRVEQTRAQWEADVAAWEAALEAAGLEPCDRCGGAGGWAGWPGYRCFKCGGHGTQEKAK